jgi:hypothetical protein
MEDSPKKRGRKAIPADQLRRAHTVSLTDFEYKKLVLNAQACGISISAYVSARAVYGNNPFVPNPRCRVQVSNWEDFVKYYPEQAATTHSLEVLRKYVSTHGPMDGWYPSAGGNSESIFCFSFTAIDLNGTFIFEFNGSAS